jgi:hypothetical protein
MSPEAQPAAELITARIRQLRLMEADMLESRKALVHLDLDAIHCHNARQQLLVEEVQRLDACLVRVGTVECGAGGTPVLSLEALARGLDAESREQLRLLLQEHETARRRVQELSEIQADLLRRSRRYLNILYNLVGNSLGLYQAPKPEFASLRAADGGYYHG